MGCYDTFIKGELDVQLKAGACLLDYFEVGSKVKDIEDGVYIAPDGIVVISNGTVIEITDKAFTKWSNSLRQPGTSVLNTDAFFGVGKIGTKWQGVEDGVYIAQDGIVVISDGVTIETTDKVFSKWGNRIDIKELVNPHGVKWGHKIDIEKMIEPYNPYAKIFNDSKAIEEIKKKDGKQ